MSNFKGGMYRGSKKDINTSMNLMPLVLIPLIFAKVVIPALLVIVLVKFIRRWR